MIPKECKRLAEVDFPIAEVSHASNKKKKGGGHPSTLHLWWARRPLASCRAVLMGLLLPDPCDPHCPNSFKKEARRILLNKDNRPGGWVKTIETDEGLRQIALEFIADFADGNNAADPSYLGVTRSLVKAAHGDDAPLVVDPFAGGGSIPLEALRLGCEAFASDLNPVACLILKVMLEDIPRYGSAMVEKLRNAGAEIKLQAERGLVDLYPVDSDGSMPIAYLWARTVRCEAPNCGAEIPLLRSFWLCQKPNRKKALRYKVERSNGLIPRVEFEVFEPDCDRDVPAATVASAKATCLCCSTVLPPERVREQLKVQKGGADVIFSDEGYRVGGARMTAVVTLRPGQEGRHYRIPNDTDYVAIHKSQERLHEILSEWELGGKQGLCPVPDEPTPAGGGSGAGRAFSVQRYGMLQWGDLFTARQKVAHLVVTEPIKKTCRPEILPAMSLSMGKVLRHCNVLSKWHRGSETTAGAFGMQTLPMSWDFPEMHPLAPYAGGLQNALCDVTSAVRSIVKWSQSKGAETGIADATNHLLPDESADIWFTDPPYYDAIPYSDLSDFFLVWLKRITPDLIQLQDPFDRYNPLSPKSAEIVQDETKRSNNQQKDRHWFEESMARAFAQGKRIIQENGVGSVVFAHKTTEGWEALLSGLIRGGWTITGSWPIATERGARLRARESAALATSVHLICRPRPKDASVGDWANVLRELPERVRSWMERLQREGIRGADLVFACVGPALEIFSRYRTVETAEGCEISLSEYLQKVWEVVGRTALEQILGTTGSHAGDGLTGALEEDARLTALFLWTLQNTRISNDNEDEGKEPTPNKTKTKGLSLPFDVVRRFAQPMGIDLEVWRGSIIMQKKGVVRLLPVRERVKDLFGEEGEVAPTEWIKIDSQRSAQGMLFDGLDVEALPKRSRRKKRIIGEDPEFEVNNSTVLDRVHAAMLLQASGHASELRMLISAEQSRGPEFLRLANALSALYPRGSQEKQLLDAMLLAVPR
ncbi:MAG: DUF1156 domain-containing protein [Bacteroidetes bacterium]|nr:DUF1156 domain-containing protein [Bacteroidota bacterium]